MYFNKFPYTDFHELNLDFLLNHYSDLIKDIAELSEKVDATKEELEAYTDALIARLIADGTISGQIGGTFYGSLYNELEKISKGQASVITCLGDSLTYGTPSSGSGQSTHPYPAMLQTHISRYNTGVSVINRGTAGEASDGGITKLPLLLTDNAKIAIWAYGENDIRLGTGLSNYIANTLQFITYCQSRSILPVVVGLETVYSQEYLVKGNLANVYANAAKILCSVTGTIFIDMTNEIKYLVQGAKLIPSINFSGVHWDDYTDYAGIIFKTLFPGWCVMADTRYLPFRNLSSLIKSDSIQNVYGDSYPFSRLYRMQEGDTLSVMFYTHDVMNCIIQSTLDTHGCQASVTIDGETIIVNNNGETTDHNVLANMFVKQIKPGIHTFSINSVMPLGPSASYFFISGLKIQPSEFASQTIGKYTGITPRAQTVNRANSPFQYHFYNNGIEVTSGVTWSLDPTPSAIASGTTISTSGLLTVASNQADGTFRVVASYAGNTYSTAITTTH